MPRPLRPICGFLSHAVILLGCATWTAGQQAVPPIEGETVILRSLDVEIESDGRHIPTGDCFRVYYVQGADGDRLQVWGDHFYPTGWVKRSDVVASVSAIDYFSGRIKREPRSAHDYFLRGATLLRFGQVELAKDDLVHAISLDAKLIPARLELAKAKSRGPDSSGARDDLDVAIRLDPNSAPAHLYRAEMLQLEGSFGSAISDITGGSRLPTHEWLLVL